MDTPSVLLSAVDKNGEIVSGTKVIVNALTEEGSEEVLNQTIEKGKGLNFKSEPPESITSIVDSNLISLVYEVYFIAPNGESIKQFFSVPHLKNADKFTIEELIDLENKRTKTVQVQFTGESIKEKVLKMNSGLNKSEIANTVTSSSSNCVLWGNVQRCKLEERTYSQPTLVGQVAIGSGENVKFEFQNASSVKISTGIKLSTDSSWSAGQSVDVTTSSGTGVTYNFTGTCQIFWGVSECNLLRDVYIQYGYRYTKESVLDTWTNFSYIEEYITPIGVGGSTSKVTWTYNANNGKPASQVSSGTHGALNFEIFYISPTNNGTTSKQYSKDRTIANAFNLNVGTSSFSGSITTNYKNSHNITWSAPNNNKKYYHYDMNSGGAMYYVTQ